MSETLEQSAKRAWLEVYELRKERDMHKQDALNYLSLWNATVIERDELKVELQKELQRRWDGNEDSSREYRELAKENEVIAAQNVALRSALQDIRDDMVERFDMDSPSTNPGMKFVTEQATDALNLPNLAESILRKRDAATLRRAADHFDHAINLVLNEGRETLTAIELRRMAAEIEGEAK